MSTPKWMQRWNKFKLLNIYGLRYTHWQIFVLVFVLPFLFFSSFHFFPSFVWKKRESRNPSFPKLIPMPNKLKLINNLVRKPYVQKRKTTKKSKKMNQKLPPNLRDIPVEVTILKWSVASTRIWLEVNKIMLNLK